MVHRKILGGTTAPSPSVAFHHKMGMMMHMTFYWGKYGEVLFHGWPGRDARMYYISLAAVFFAAVVLEALSHCSFLTSSSNRAAVVIYKTVLYTLRSGVSYMVMLAVMCFNVGIFVAAVAGHGVGFLLFGSWRSGKPTDLPQASCSC